MRTRHDARHGQGIAAAFLSVGAQLPFPGPHGGRLSRSAKALSPIQRRRSSSRSRRRRRCSVVLNYSSARLASDPGRSAGRPVREDCARRNVNEGVYGPSCPKGREMIYKAYLDPWPGQAAVTCLPNRSPQRLHSPMLTFATKKLSTGANGQKKVLFVRAVPKLPLAILIASELSCVRLSRCRSVRPDS